MTSMTRPLLAAVLVGLGLFGGYVGPYLIDINGLGASCLQHFLAPPHQGYWFAPQPFSSVRRFTGVTVLDDILAVLLGFFSAMVDGDVDPSQRLYSVWGMAQFAACWTLLSLEGSRAGNRGKLISFVSIMGLTVQVASVMLTVPLWLAWHLYSSPVSGVPGKSKVPMSALLISDAWELVAVPIVVMIVYVLPAIVMYLPPSLVSTAVHYRAMAWWQPFPLFHVVLNTAIAFLGHSFVGPLAVEKKEYNPVVTDTYMVYVRKVYAFATALGVAAQLPIVFLAFAPPTIRSSLLTLAGPGLRAWMGLHGRHEGSPVFSLWSIFVPASPGSYPTVNPASLGSGEPAGPAIFFFHYDMYIGIGAALLWAMYLYQRTARQPQTFPVVLKATAWFAVGGPSAALASLLWDRDMAASKAEESESYKGSVRAF